MTAEQIISTIGLVGLGGLLKSSFDYFISSKKTKNESRHNFKEVRYKSIILLGFALINYEKERATLIINRPDITSSDRLKNELEAEFINMSLYGSDQVILKLKELIITQNRQALSDLAFAMRKDLYGIKTKLRKDHINI
jgi:hypothetical protein